MDKINKYKLDAFRLAVFVAKGGLFELPESIKTYMKAYVDIIKSDLPVSAYQHRN